MAKLRLVVLAAVVGSGCAVSEPVTAQQVSALLPSGDGCPREECGGSGNSPVMDGVYFWSLSFDHKPNNQGFRLITAFKLGAEVDLSVAATGDRLIGRYHTAPYGLLEHHDLEQVVMFLVRGARSYRVRIVTVTPVGDAYWVGPGTIEDYDLRYTPYDDGVPEDKDHDGRPDEHWLCSHPTGDPNEVNAIVFDGDIYDADTKHITTGAGAAGWFNIACYMGAPWKMQMMGHTGVANAILGIDTPLDKRRALLNAWTSNVCGTGTAFTHPGEPITLHEQPDLLPPGNGYLDDEVSHEAVWGADGALCLDAPRLWEEDLEIRSKIQTDCGGKLPPPCTRGWPAGGYVSTGNPAEP